MPTFLLSELTRGEVTVALSGDGGDEGFAGYERFAAGLAARRFAALPAPVRRTAVGAAGLLPATALSGRAGRLQRFAGVAEQGLPDAYRAWISTIQDPEREALLDGGRDDWGAEDYRAIWESSAGAHPLDRLLDLNLRTYLLDDLLVKTDRMSMAHGLEVRCPFLDTELLAFAARLPPAFKARGLSLKRVLKAAVEDLLPRQILQPGEAWVRRAAGSLVSRGPARLRGRHPGRRRRAGEGSPGAGGGRPPDRRARRAAAQPRVRALDPADARGLPAARGLVIDGRGRDPAQPGSR